MNEVDERVLPAKIAQMFLLLWNTLEINMCRFSATRCRASMTLSHDSRISICNRSMTLVAFRTDMTIERRRAKKMKRTKTRLPKNLLNFTPLTIGSCIHYYTHSLFNEWIARTCIERLWTKEIFYTVVIVVVARLENQVKIHFRLWIYIKKSFYKILFVCD